jgi:integrase
MPLTDVTIRNAKPSSKPYKLTDAQGLYVLVSPSGSRYFRWDYRFAGKRRTYAIGVYPSVSLAAARERRDGLARLLKAGSDPAVEKRASALALKQATENSFKSVAIEWLAHRETRLSEKYAKQVRARLEADIFPKLGNRPINQISAYDLLETLRAIEKSRNIPETIKRLRQYCSMIFRFGIVTQRCERDPSADIRGALKPAPRQKHHAALPLERLGSFMVDLEAYGGNKFTKQALKLIVLIFPRTNELRQAKWTELEGLETASPVWRIPAERMKKRVEHVIPLPEAAVQVINDLKRATGSSPFVFPGKGKERCLSSGAMDRAIERLGYADVATVHGFRAVASTALNEMGFDPDVIEAQLAHTQQNEVRAAYNRAKYLEQRRTMLEQWSEHVQRLMQAALGDNVEYLARRGVAISK